MSSKPDSREKMEEHTEQMLQSGYHKLEPPGCVVRHVSHLAKDNPCSHRGQGYKAALELATNKTVDGIAFDGKWYNEYDTAAIKQKWSRRISVGSWSGRYKAVSHPRKGMVKDLWHIGKHGNFEGKSTYPYLHAHHHMIPNSVLNNQLWDEGGVEDQLLYLIMAGQYNINHKRNIIMLPRERWVGKVVELPMHCPPPARSHGQYSAFVEPRLDNLKAQLKRLLGNKTVCKIGKKAKEGAKEEAYKISDKLRKILKSLEAGSNLNRTKPLEEVAKRLGL